MARPKIIIEDSFDSIFRDLERVSRQGANVIYEEMATCVGEIIDNTPQKSGHAAASWLEAAENLKAPHSPIVQGHTRGGRKKKDGTYNVIRSYGWGTKQGYYKETHRSKSGKELNKLTIEAGSKDFVMLAMEYGFKVGTYKFKAMRIVRNAVHRMKERIGIHFNKAMRITLRKPKKKKKTVI